MTFQNKTWLWADWPAPENIRAGTTTRKPGFSQNQFAMLNLATHVGDDKYHVEKNRNFLVKHLKLSSPPYWLSQTHSNRIICLDDVVTDTNADGAYTTIKNRICTIMTADCVPLLFCNSTGTKVAAVHAGWKGICNGIIEKAVELLDKPSTIMVWIGPCICAKHYEVGTDVYDSCRKHLSLTQTAFEQTDKNHWQCDLVSIVKIILKNRGIGAIYECGLCTYEQENLFYSYRRDGVTGRTASMIWME